MPTLSQTEPLPKGWRWGEPDARIVQLAALPTRVRVLLAAEWARSVLSIFEARYPDDARPRKAIEAAETWARDPSAAARAAAADAARDAARAADAADDAARAAAAAARAADAADDAADAARAAAAATRAADAAADAAEKKKWHWIYATYRHARGPGIAFEPAWRTDTAVALARQIVGHRAFDLMPILADALQDAGCEDSRVIEHLQQDADEWTCADWSLWNLLGYGE